MHPVDIIIVGGGLVGAGLAMALRDSGLRIALIEAKLPSNNDPRLFALNTSSCQFLQHVGVWAALSAQASPIHAVHVSYQGHFGAVRLHKDALHLPELGYMIPARFIEAALNEALAKADHVTVYRPATLLSLTQQNGKAQVTLQMGSQEHHLEANIVIGADGSDSTVRTQTHIPTQTIDYEQSALVTHTQLQRPHHFVAYERFNKQGAIAMLPLKGDECATIWSADKATIAQLAALSPAAFLAELQQRFGYRLGRLMGISERHVFPLRMVKAEKRVEGCVLLLGNAAHTLHPIAAQGFNLALYEVATLAQAILEAQQAARAFTATDLLSISEGTQAQLAMSMGASHKLSQWFSTDSIGMSIVLQLGMLGLELASPIKRTFIKRMIGRAGRVPRLLLGIHDDEQHFSH